MSTKRSTLNRPSFTGPITGVLFLEVFIIIVLACHESVGKEISLNYEFIINLTNKIPTRIFNMEIFLSEFYFED